MKRQVYYPGRAAEQILWLENLRNKITTYQAALGLNGGQILIAIADARWLVYVLGSWLPAVRAFAPSCTETALAAQIGTGASALVLTTFTPPALPATVAAMNPGSLDRLFALVALMKDAPGYTPAIGQDLNLIGPEKSAPDLSTLQPALAATLSGNRVEIAWGWQGNSAYLDLLELQVDRNDGKGYVALAFDTTPGYIDTAPFPATPAKWTYRAIYRVADAQVGMWSLPVSIIVGA